MSKNYTDIGKSSLLFWLWGIVKLGRGLVIAPVNEVIYLPERIVVIPYDMGVARKWKQGCLYSVKNNLHP